ncbi:MAG: phosphoribosylanthranilate isomerase, partial [Acidobacteria bacterium]|nr:phosphoribosylanthranilate isomerase [Acidobacteriota bacterium]
YEKSPRNVTAEMVSSIIEKLPEPNEKVAVVVEGHTHNLNFPPSLTAFQWTHTTVPENFAGLISNGSTRPFKNFVALPASNLDDASVKRLSEAFMRFTELSKMPRAPRLFDALFLDSGSALKPGGTGRPFDWNQAVPIANQVRQGPFKLVVSGGLTSENVAEAMRILHPWGVDASSGVEARPGKKDPDKVRAFINAVREADKGKSN